MKIEQSEDIRVRGGVEALERAIDLLQCFRAPGEALTLAELAQRSGFYKSTILRIAASLQFKGFLLREADGRFRLGAELKRLGDRVSTSAQLQEVLRPVLRMLQAETSETVSFYVRSGDDRICLLRENSQLSVRHHLDEGTRQQLGRGAAGRVLSSFGAVSRGGDAALLRRQGFLVSEGGRDPDLSAVAVPVVNAAGELIGALAISGLRRRFSAERVSRLGKLLLTQAKALKARLPESQDPMPTA